MTCVFISAIEEATDLYKKSLKWKPRSPTPQRIVDRAWGLRDYKQPEIGEEFVRGYSKLQGLRLHSPERPSLEVKAKSLVSSFRESRQEKLANTRHCESVCSRRSDVINETSRSSFPSTKNSRRKESVKLRPMSERVRGSCLFIKAYYCICSAWTD